MNAPALLAAVAALAASAAGPSAPDIARALAAASPATPPAPVRIVECHPEKAAPDQAGCTYETQSPTGQWSRWGGVFARQDGQWKLVVGPVIVTLETDPRQLTGITAGCSFGGCDPPK